MSQVKVKVSIPEKNRKLGAMAKALAFEVGNKNAVVGAKKDFLNQHGYYIFHFGSTEQAKEFMTDIGTYLPKLLASYDNSDLSG
jgi:hypothetical protein